MIEPDLAMDENQLSIEPASPTDLEAILTMLADNGLPLEGAAACLPSTLVARLDGQLAGSVALELYGRAALLRSLVVKSDMRGQGIGRKLTGRVLALARRYGIETTYLLTETAAPFFAQQFDFSPVDRRSVDPNVQRSVEFTTACPDSALAMKLDL